VRTRSLFAAAAIVVALGIAPAQAASASVVHVSAASFSNCKKLNAVYKHGVGRSGAHDKVTGKSKPVTNFKISTTLYKANSKRDGDKDGVACEKH
jgi:hypothetical protein